ncbi:hypothetical protein MUK72_17800 (plasmid) [Halococcus dombrowskii]|uniref:DUF7847 domain-containing protein n=2 Tax=Halococcus dombrowskii TaxID=179637 RepID=A0AAX3ASY1_HALDO|nr:hypothetical protein [Halococcus dombrowskii]UOO97234.1 hypothetical protein MUK72_17800 [Halococcus dombrowskii]
MSTSPAPSEKMENTRTPGIGEIIKRGVSVATDTPILFGLYLIVAIAGMISSPLNSIATLVVDSIAVVIAYSALQGRKETTRPTLTRIFYAILAAFVGGIATGLASLLLVIPGIYLLVRFRLTIPAVMIEECGPIDGLQRSWALTSGHGWTVFGFVVIFAIASFILSGATVLLTGGIPTGPNAIAALQQPIAFGGGLASVIIGPIQISGMVVMYEAFRRKSP